LSSKDVKRKLNKTLANKRLPAGEGVDSREEKDDQKENGIIPIFSAIDGKRWFSLESFIR